MADDAPLTGRRLDPAEYEPLPWHADTWQRLMKSRARLPHALLLLARLISNSSRIETQRRQRARLLP